MNVTSLYWAPPQVYQGVKSQNLQEHRRGFQFDIPWRDPVTSGWNYGENPLAGRKELVYSAQPEYFAVQNIIPSVGGIPRYNPYDRAFHYSREHVTTKF